MADDRVSEMTLRWNEPLAFEITAAVQRRDAARPVEIRDHGTD